MLSKTDDIVTGLLMVFDGLVRVATWGTVKADSHMRWIEHRITMRLRDRISAEKSLTRKPD